MLPPESEPDRLQARKLTVRPREECLVWRLPLLCRCFSFESCLLSKCAAVLETPFSSPGRQRGTAYLKPPLARTTWLFTHPPSGPSRNDTTPAMSSDRPRVLVGGSFLSTAPLLESLIARIRCSPSKRCARSCRPPHPNPVSGRRHGIAEPLRDGAARGLETRPCVSIMESWNRNQFALVKPCQSRIDHVFRRHHDRRRQVLVW